MSSTIAYRNGNRHDGTESITVVPLALIRNVDPVSAEKTG